MNPSSALMLAKRDIGVFAYVLCENSKHVVPSSPRTDNRTESVVCSDGTLQIHVLYISCYVCVYIWIFRIRLRREWPPLLLLSFGFSVPA